MTKWRWIAPLLGLLFCCRQPETSRGGQLVVAASIAPLADFCRQVGGECVSVFTVVPAGTNPHTFELSPDHLKRLATARLLVLNGIGLEYWADKVADNFSPAALQVVWVSTGIPVLQDSDHAAGNPHVWLNPVYAMVQIENIVQALIRVDPAHADQYRQNGNRLKAQLSALDQHLAAEISTWQHKSFICFHPSWNYFANRYGLHQAAVIEKRPGFEPSPADVAEVIALAKQLHSKAIFAEQQFPIKVSEMIAHECGATVLVLDPLGSDAKDFAYTKMLARNVAEMAKGLK